MSKHTPTPWKISKHPEQSEWYANITGTYGKGANGLEEIRTITCNTRYGTPEEQEANAEFIIRACNAHDDLVDALETMYRICNLSGDDSPHRVKARAALDKAKPPCA